MPEPKVTPEPKTARIKPHGRFSPVWLVPIVAAALVGYLGYSALASRGPTVTLTLLTADGLTVDQTEVKHKHVTVGTVDSIALAPDLKSVVVQVRMTAGTDAMLTDHARFWVVRPRLSAGSLTGLETLVSGAYIEVDPGDPGGKKERAFKALPEPPGRQSDEPGKVFVLRARHLGSLGAGSPLYYRDVEVGEVLSYDLGQALGRVTMRVFVRAPYDTFVHPETQFWNASGLSIAMGAEGLRIEMQSLQTLLSGGIAFETPVARADEPPAPESAAFDLYEDKATADNALYRDTIPYVSYFHTSVQGLSRGSPVLISGVQVGNVSEVGLVYDLAERGMVARVAFVLQPERVAARAHDKSAEESAHVREAFSEGDMRVTLEASNLLTGAKDLSILYSTKRRTAPDVREGDALVLPSEGGGIEGLTASLAEVAAKVNQIPFKELGDHANAVLANLDRLVTEVDTRATPVLAQLPGVVEQMSAAAKGASGAFGASGYGQDSAFQHDLERLLSEASDASRSVRVLADYLDRHPEALIRGRASQQGNK